jgi:hypothetical protein
MSLRSASFFFFSRGHTWQVYGMMSHLSTGSIFGELPVRVQYDEM